MSRLLIATNNRGKVAEFRRLLAGRGWELPGDEPGETPLPATVLGPAFGADALVAHEAFEPTQVLQIVRR
jgi:inosine/xanthosine triphosphate pyrophosphatase family protein